MAQQHFTCPACQELVLLTYPAALVDDPDRWPPRCDRCGEPLDRAPQPGDFAVDAKEPFQRFAVTRQVPQINPETGQTELVYRQEVIDSVHRLRKIETDSEQRFRDGEGEPLRFRAWNQDHSNRDVNSFGQEGEVGGRRYDSGKTPVRKRNISITRHGQKEPQVAVARGAGQTALPLK